uniref:Protein MULTIPOLAR SPINDLE 1 n=1 Tax=Nelumbo nucifera TaxID=4432 RepID=A0A822ZPA4_NELNU|nr:TPA_asm: hypothetical protein HUJ06_003555 [Nelumbo nucifera]
MEKTQKEIMESDQSLKLAVAIALVRSKLLGKSSSDLSSSNSEPDAQRWKRKAKERKWELLRLKEELKELEDGIQYDLFPQSASCKCYFFDKLGELNPKRLHLEYDSDQRVNEVLRRRFLRQVRLNERRRKPDDSVRIRRILDSNSGDEIEQLSTSVDFLVELCDSVSPLNDTSFANLSHQAVDFILASLEILLSKGNNKEAIEGIINKLIMRLVRRMGDPSQKDESSNSGSYLQFYVQHLIRKVGRKSYIGQRAMLMVSQRISVLADTLLCMDPFDGAFPNMHSCMFMMIQLTEFLISDYTQTWTTDEGFENKLFEEWVRSVIHARKALELLESRNGLYMLYMDRVTGELVKQVGRVSFLPELDPDILDGLVR